MNISQLNMDCFASGQIGSKLWLCEELEKILEKGSQVPQVIHLIGGWYGILALILRARNRFHIESILNIDLDGRACELSKKVNDFWIWHSSSFSTLSLDVNNLNTEFFREHRPSLIINTSVEHMINTQWFEAVPAETRVVLQSCDMKHSDHTVLCFSAEDLIRQFPLSQIEFQGQTHFDYKNETSFTRFMIIGKK